MLGRVYTTDTVCGELGINADTLRQLVDTDQILRATTADGLDVYPAFQISNDGTLLLGMSDVIAELAAGVDDPWTWWNWLVASSASYRGRASWEMMRDGEIETVVKEACRTAWVWRQ